MNVFSIFRLRKKDHQKSLSEIKTEILMKKWKEQLQKLSRMGVRFSAIISSA